MSKLPLIGRMTPWLAPLAGHTDLALRVLCREQGAAAACSEMVSAKGLIYGQRSRKQDGGTTSLLLTLPGTLGSDNFHPASLQPNLPLPDSLVFAAQCPRLSLADFPALDNADTPLVIQLFGDDPQFLGQAVELLRAWGYDWFDLNLGCSVPKVVKTGAGTALARDLDKTLRAAEAMIRAAGALPPGSEQVAPGKSEQHSQTEISQRFPQGRVGFKLRLGWTAAEENYLELAKGLEQCGAGWLTLHPRYARQGFTGSADWSALAKLRKAVNLPIMASGDLLNAASALRCLEESGVDGVMFARGALHNPAIFSEYLRLVKNTDGGDKCAALGPGEAVPAVLQEQAALLKTLILRHAELAQAMPEKNPHCRRRRNGPECAGQERMAAAKLPRPDGALLKMRGAIPRYVRELPGSRAFRIEMSLCESWDDFYTSFEKFFQPFEF